MLYRVAFVTDVAGLRSSAEAEAYRGLQNGLAAVSCSRSQLIVSRRPSDYAANLESAANMDNLVVAGSFLLTSSLDRAARAKPEGHFLLVDPIAADIALPNVAVLTFRRDQAAFLAGALAAMLTRSGSVAAVFGPDGLDDVTAGTAFEHGAKFVRSGVTVLAAYQPPDQGEPYNNPSWGADQARALSARGADVIFAGNGGTGRGALAGAASAGRLCIGTEIGDSSAPSCLVASTRADVTLGVQLLLARLITGWTPGTFALGLKDGAVGLSRVGSALPTDIQQRLGAIGTGLADGSVTTGV